MTVSKIIAYMKVRLQKLPALQGVSGVSLILALVAVLAVIGHSYGYETGNPRRDDTMLMFVGEDLEVVTIASRREESAWQSPAVAQVITREEIEASGMTTLRQALEKQPGFYMAQKEWGSRPYLRGIADSILFLHDTIPMGSSMTKSMSPIDDEFSLSSVKRIEIVRGPGSVLWGPDAFAGIVNVVPLTGKDLDGVETGVFTEGPDEKTGVYLNAGHRKGYWDTFLSVSGREGYKDSPSANVEAFWGDDQTFLVPLEDRFGDIEPGHERYGEISGRVSYRDWLTLSGRFADSHNPYTVSSADGELTWREIRDTESTMLKLEALKKLSLDSALRLTGAYHDNRQLYTIIDKELQQDEKTTYAELIYDHSFFNRCSLLTSGVSYRRQWFDNVPVWNYFLPDYIGGVIELFDADIPVENHDDTLWSFFTQYTHKVSDATELMLGLRYDSHDAYEDKLSFNSGLVWTPDDAWIFKLLYGTAYRSPFADQLVDEADLELEMITSLSLQAAWKPFRRTEISVTGFEQQIDHHVIEDIYQGAGLSHPNSQTIRGLELSLDFSPWETLTCSANLTLLDNSGPNEKYWFEYARLPKPDGTVEYRYTESEYAYDTGPDTLMNINIEWHPLERLDLFAGLRYCSAREMMDPKEDRSETCPETWLLDMNAVFHDFFFSHTDLELSVRNLMDTDYETPGTYHTIAGDGAMFRILIKKRW